jgi:protein-L-isoaspartate O-methyltransferase
MVELLDLEPGMVIADIGAGLGEWSVALSRHVAPSGHVFATEIDPLLVAEIRKAVEKNGIENISPILSGVADPALPTECCDLIVVRAVYHEFTEWEAMNAGLHQALCSDGILAIFDNEPDGSGHGIEAELAIEQITAAGFELMSREDSWDGEQYVLLFRRAN